MPAACTVGIRMNATISTAKQSIMRMIIIINLIYGLECYFLYLTSLIQSHYGHTYLKSGTSQMHKGLVMQHGELLAY